MKWDHGVILFITFLLLALAVQSRGTVIEGAYTKCVWEWKPWAANARQYLGPDDLYIVAHGYYSQVYPLCNRPPVKPEQLKMHRFGFLAVCDGLCAAGKGTFADRSRETVGYCGMSTVGCYKCWRHSLAFQARLFRTHAVGAPWAVAYQKTMAAYPECRGCIRYYANQDTLVSSGS